jgi:hypothetical protein
VLQLLIQLVAARCHSSRHLPVQTDCGAFVQLALQLVASDSPPLLSLQRLHHPPSAFSHWPSTNIIKVTHTPTSCRRGHTLFSPRPFKTAQANATSRNDGAVTTRPRPPKLRVHTAHPAVLQHSAGIPRPHYTNAVWAHVVHTPALHRLSMRRCSAGLLCSHTGAASKLMQRLDYATHPRCTNTARAN